MCKFFCSSVDRFFLLNLKMRLKVLSFISLFVGCSLVSYIEFLTHASFSLLTDPNIDNDWSINNYSVIHVKFQASESRFCLWSKKTAECVPSCPQSKEEMEARAKNKDCVSIAHSQNCTKPEQFKYHCLINEFENASFEVCAESYYIVSGRVLVANYNLNRSFIRSTKVFVRRRLQRVNNFTFLISQHLEDEKILNCEILWPYYNARHEREQFYKKSQILKIFPTFT